MAVVNVSRHTDILRHACCVLNRITNDIRAITARCTQCVEKEDFDVVIDGIGHVVTLSVRALAVIDGNDFLLRLAFAFIAQFVPGSEHTAAQRGLSSGGATF